MNFAERQYQTRAEDATFRAWETDQATCFVMATGLGKTATFAKIIKRMGRRALVMAHREELIYQNYETIRAVTGLQPGIEMGWNKVAHDGFLLPPVVVGTVQSIVGRLDSMRPEDYGMLVIDEAHRTAAPSYRKVLDHFKQNPSLKILGVTATPHRSDEVGLEEIFGERPCFTYDILDGINDGWLVPVTQQFCMVGSLDVSHIHTSRDGDFNQRELQAVMEAEENVQGIVHPSLEVLYGLPPKTLNDIPVADWGKYLANLGRDPRKAICFTASVPQAEAACNILNRVVPGLAEWICGKTPKDNRQDIIRRYHQGKTSVLCNCNVLTEGFDAPKTDIIFMARPTKSRLTYTQMAGRGTRALPGIVDGLGSADERKLAIANSDKPRVRIVDFVGNSGKHKLVCAIDVLAGKYPVEVLDRVKARMQTEGKPQTVLTQLANEEIEIQNEKKAEQERIKAESEARRANLIAKSRFDMVDVDAFGQRQFAVGTSKRALEPCTSKQGDLLRPYGINPKGVSKKVASWIIGILADNDWMLPEKYKFLRNKYQ